jgi:hypothetical protein
MEEFDMKNGMHSWICTAVLVLVGISIALTGSVAAQSTGYVDVAASDLAGSGTTADPYVITNASELQAMEDDLDAYYKLTGDIDASVTAQWNDGAGFDPVGDGSGDFKGGFDGNQYNISGLTIDRSSSGEEVGLFGEVDSAVIESVHINSATITGNRSVGALAGYLEQDVTVRYVSMDGSVSGKINTGGVVGASEASIVKIASAKGTVTGSDDVGGLAGQNVGSVVTQSSSQATVTATGGDFARAGGLVGGNYENSIINKSYATGDVTGGKAGGITGENYDGSRVANTYAAGNVDGRSERSTGGVSGENIGACPFRNEQQCEGFEASTITDSYWDTEATGQSTSAGNTIGLTTSEMTGSAAETNMAKFAFGSIWQTQPDGYPILVQQADSKSDQSGSAQVQLSSVTLTPQSVDSASESTHQLSFEAQNISADGSEDDFDITFPDKVELVSYSDVEIDEKSSDVNKVDNTLEFSVDPTGGGSTQISGELNVTVSATN